jgi:hypothetical protein
VRLAVELKSFNAWPEHDVADLFDLLEDVEKELKMRVIVGFLWPKEEEAGKLPKLSRMLSQVI